MDKVKRLQLAIHLDEIEAARSDIQEHGADVRYLDYLFVLILYKEGLFLLLLLLLLLLLNMFLEVITLAVTGFQGALHLNTKYNK